MRRYFCIVCRDCHYEFPGDQLFSSGSHMDAAGQTIPLGYCQQSSLITNLCYRKVKLAHA